jgi:hypothetical protein
VPSEETWEYLLEAALMPVAPGWTDNHQNAKHLVKGKPSLTTQKCSAESIALKEAARAPLEQKAAARPG